MDTRIIGLKPPPVVTVAAAVGSKDRGETSELVPSHNELSHVGRVLGGRVPAAVSANVSRPPRYSRQRGVGSLGDLRGEFLKGGLNIEEAFSDCKELQVTSLNWGHFKGLWKRGSELRRTPRGSTPTPTEPRFAEVRLHLPTFIFTAIRSTFLSVF